MSVMSEYLFALDQWKLLEQWKVHILSTLSISSEVKLCILNSIKHRSIYDVHINVYSPNTYRILTLNSGQLKYEVHEYSRLEGKMFLVINKLRAKIISKIRYDASYVKYFLLDSIRINKILGNALTGYHIHLLELIIVEELSPVHMQLKEMKLYIYLEKALFIGIDIRYTLYSMREVIVVSCKRELTAQQESLLKNIFNRAITKTTQETK